MPSSPHLVIAVQKHCRLLLLVGPPPPQDAVNQASYFGHAECVAFLLDTYGQGLDPRPEARWPL